MAKTSARKRAITAGPVVQFKPCQFTELNYTLAKIYLVETGVLALVDSLDPTIPQDTNALVAAFTAIYKPLATVCADTICSTC